MTENLMRCPRTVRIEEMQSREKPMMAMRQQYLIQRKM